MNLKPSQAEQNSVIVVQNSHIDELLFIKRGIISIEYNYLSYIIKISRLRHGEHFGEVNMLLHKKCPFDLVVKSKKAELLSLSKASLIELGNEFPDLFKRLTEKALINYSLFKTKKKKGIKNVKLKLKKLKLHTICSINRQNQQNKDLLICDKTGLRDRTLLRYGLNRSIIPIQEESSNEYDNDSTDHKFSQVILSKESKSFLRKQLSNPNVRVTKLSSFSYDSPKRKFLRPKL